jgi:hypothetical protein
VSVAYLDLADYLAIAAEVTGLDVNTLTRVAKLDLADSALHAPRTGFGEIEAGECASRMLPRQRALPLVAGA